MSETAKTDEGRVIRTGPIVRAIAEGCKQRAEALSLTGKKRDSMALDYFCGAATAAHAAGDAALSSHIARIAGWIIATRGYAGMLDLVLKEEG